MSHGKHIKGTEHPYFAEQRAREQAATHRSNMMAKWSESERIVSLLRSIQPTASHTPDQLIEEWYKATPVFQENPASSNPYSSYEPPPTSIKPVFHSANEWFGRYFTKQAQSFGSPFIEEIVSTRDSFVCTPVSLNAFFFAALLGGNTFLGHQVVFFPPEDRFYFLDPAVSAFRPTSAEKLQLVVSHYLWKCAGSCSNKVSIRPLVEEFTKDKVLRGITERAKAILEADRSFFEGPDGRVRYIDGKRLNPADGPSHRQFATEVIARQQGSWLTISQAYSQYALYCRQKGLTNISPPEFKSFMAVEILDTFNLKMRHDVPAEDGRQTHGWRDLACLVAA